VLNEPALEALAKMLASVNASFALATVNFGRVEIVRQASENAAKVFQEYAKATPSKADAYAAALAFVRGQTLDERQVDLVASALSERILEYSGARALGHRKLPELLDGYAGEAEQGSLWRLTWFGLLGSYFAFDPRSISSEEQSGWQRLRMLLAQTWPVIDRESGHNAVPDWVRVVRGDPDLLGSNAAKKYAADFLKGDESAVQKLADDLGIPESSWFWHELVLSAVRTGTAKSDAAFKDCIPRLLALIQARPVYRDEALELLLERYFRCPDKSVHRDLRDYVVRKDVWRNPKLRDAGLATAWNRVSEDVWRMVLQWVNKANLRDFFEVLAARRRSDEGRLDFWSGYMEQISWTRLIFSAETRSLAHTNAGIRNLIAREEDSYATMSSNADVDAFMMQLGDYVVVEFSRQPNAAYVYKADQLPFDPYGREYTGTTSDLKHGFHGEKAARFTHQNGWATEAGRELRRLGIYPDEPTSRPAAPRAPQTRAPAPRAPDVRIQVPEPRTQQIHVDPGIEPQARGSGLADAAPPGATFTMMYLRSFIDGHPGVTLIDKRGTSGGRLWVEDPAQRLGIGNELKRLGFKWAATRQAWYYPEG